MSERNEMNQRRTARILMVACGLLFSVFCFVYVFSFQKHLLEALHFYLSEGKTQFSPVFTATFITTTLLIVRWGINRVLKLKGVLHTWTYFPSCLLLGILTDIGYSVYVDGGMNGIWLWLLPLVLILYVLVSCLLKRLLGFSMEVQKPGTVVNVNLVILLFLCLMSVCMGNTDMYFHQELAMESAIRKGDYQQAYRVGENVKAPTRTMTALRAYALSREQKLGEELFAYTQPYRAEGLRFDVTNERTLRMNNDSLSAYWGDIPQKDEKAVDFFARLCKEETGSYKVLDYYLSALLLDRQLHTFVRDYEAMYSVEDSVPVHYREALFLYEKLFSSSHIEQTDSILEKRWQRYEQLKQLKSDRTEELPDLQREFGNTYWWYYQNR